MLDLRLSKFFSWLKPTGPLPCRDATLFGAFNKFSDWLIIIRKGHKMLAGLLARRWCKSPENFVYRKEWRKTAWFQLRVRTADPTWLCIFHLSLCITQSIKANLENKETDQFLERLLSLVSFLLLFFSGWIPIWSVKARRVYLFALASKTHTRGSPRRGSSGRRWPT